MQKKKKKKKKKKESSSFYYDTLMQDREQKLFIFCFLSAVQNQSPCIIY